MPVVRFAPAAWWPRLFHRLRTEGDTPVRQASAIALGLFIGCTPLIGLHLTLAVMLGTLFRLNRVKVYLAANISNPFVAPFLYVTEIQTGAWLRRGTWYSPGNWAAIRLGDVAGDIFVGCLVVGGVLAATMGLVTYSVVNRRGVPREVAILIERAASRYIEAGVTAWEFANGKLRGDRVYLDVLRSGLLPPSGTIVDLGCGQGLMLSLIVSARDMFRRREWPADYPPPPVAATLVGVELRTKVAAMAARALAGEATIVEQNIVSAPLATCDAVLVFDVLHLVPAVDQLRILRAVAAALVPGGLLVVREANAAAGPRFHAVRFGNRLTAIVQGKWRRSFHFRTAGEWKSVLESAGFTILPGEARGAGGSANVTIFAARRVDHLTRLETVDGGASRASGRID
jgi:uncharacterized protein (DUF2062 family)/2-polyprenyl-3-methyl-5-hydroxy-6-metoxy-1,4-benzoquinol methylase